MLAEHALGQEQVLGHPALTDPTTGLANRLHFELVYRYLFLSGDRGMAFTLMLVSVGDDDALSRDVERLASVGQAIQRSTRGSDLVAYVGGNRFVVLLIGTNLPGARIAADRIEGTLRELAAGRVAVGLASFGPDMTESTELLRAVEGALSTAEEAGGGVEMA